MGFSEGIGIGMSCTIIVMCIFIAIIVMVHNIAEERYRENVGTTFAVILGFLFVVSILTIVTITGT